MNRLSSLATGKNKQQLKKEESMDKEQHELIIKELKESMEKELQESRKKYIARHCIEHEWEEFCRELYTALWVEADGFDNPAMLCHVIYEKSGIDPVAVAFKNGFSCFEEMMHCEKLKGVVAIQKEKTTNNGFPFTIVKYMAALDKDKFNDIRQNYKRRFHDISIDPTLAPHVFSSLGDKPMMPTNFKEVTGPLINYDVVDEFVEKMLIQSDEEEECDEDEDEAKESDDKKMKQTKKDDQSEEGTSKGKVEEKSSEAGTSKEMMEKKKTAMKDEKPLKKGN